MQPPHETPSNHLLDRYLTLRTRERLTPAEARRELHVHYREAAAFERVLLKEILPLAQERGIHIPSDVTGEEEPLAPEAYSNEALEALEDFDVFRKRYFGRHATPWQREAADNCLKLLETPHKEFLVVNCPPGSGKSTCFTHDIPAWLICRNRALRSMIGSYTERQAVQYVGRLRRSFTRKTPVPEADATLLKDFGGFRPLLRDLWRVNEFIVAQHGETEISEKEPTVAGFGFDSAFLGGRFDFIIWDDLVDKHVLRSRDAIDAMERWFGDEAETRTEPGGLFVLQGQRMAGVDLYRFALDLKLEDGTPKYHHIKYKAHYDDLCEEMHGVDAPYWPEGCLLDPVRVSWRDLAAKQRNAPDRYQILFQQEDIDEGSALVRRIWLEGGTENDVQYAGCFDRNRAIGDLPPDWPECNGVITVDPSATNKWGLIYWVINPKTEVRYLVDIFNGSLQASEFLDYNFEQGQFNGLLERWYQKYLDKGLTTRFVVVEVNAAQRYLLQSRQAQQWSAQRHATFVPHTTTIKKNDPQYGVQALSPLFQFGQMRLPGKGENPHLQEFIGQLLAWPTLKYDDLLMSCYFLEAAWQNVSVNFQKTPTFWRPSWMRNERRGIVSFSSTTMT